jgi:hypothetical protein
MKRVTLMFPDTKSLWSFAQTLRSNSIHVNSTILTITCNCTETDVSKAVLQFDAKILDEIEERTYKL